MTRPRVYRTRRRQVRHVLGIAGLIFLCLLAGVGVVTVAFGFALMGGWR